MKKGIICIVLCFFAFSIKVEAECTPAEVVELNTLASHVNYTYKFNEEKRTFDVVFNNLKEELELEEGNDIGSGNSVIYNKHEGEVLIVKINASQNSKCPLSLLRIMRITLPYKNPFYNTETCEGYENLFVCNTEFFDYFLDYTTFQNILNKQIAQENNTSENKDVETPKTETNLFDNILLFFKNYWIEGIILIGTSSVVFLVGNFVFKNVKYKL